MTLRPERSRPRRPRRALALALVVGTALAGCSSERELEISAKRENLDLAYRKAELAKQPETIQQIVEEAPPTVFGLPSNAADVAKPMADRPTPTTLPATVPAPRGCRVAPRQTPASSQTTTSANAAPRVGRYPAHQTGVFGIRSGTFNVQGRVPPESELQIRNVVDRSTVDAGGRAQPDFTFDEVLPGASGPIVTTYRITAADLTLTKITSGSSTFEPVPAIRIMQFADVVGTSWTSAGVDLRTTETMTVQGRIDSRSTVDLCGTVVEAYRVTSQERRVNSQTGFSYETDSAQPKVYDIATQLGALTIQIRERSTTSFVANGATVTVTLDYQRTLDGPSPAST